jgi:hypothetical protein
MRGAPRKNNDNVENSINMKTKICFALTITAGLAACSLQATGTLSASATLTETGMAGSEFEYSLVLDNTGSNPINALWYGWILGAFDLPSTPTSITGPAGWTSSTAFADSVQFENNSGSAIAPGGFGTFTFDSISSLSAMTTGITDTAPTGDSVAYASSTGPSSFDQSYPGIASDPFLPIAGSVPDGGMTAMLLGASLAGLSCVRRKF